jgi:hypothetical protein
LKENGIMNETDNDSQGIPGGPGAGGNNEGQAPKFYHLYNQTAWRIAISGGEKGKESIKKLLPPFGECVLKDADYKELNIERWKSLGGVREDELTDTGGEAAAGCFATFFGALFLAFVVWIVWRLFKKPPSGYWTVALAVALLTSILAAIGNVKRDQWRYYPGYCLRWVLHSASMLIVVGISFGLPAIVILGFGHVLSSGQPTQVGQPDSPYVKQAQSDPNDQGAEAARDISSTDGRTGRWSRAVEYLSRARDFVRRVYAKAKFTVQEAKKKEIHGLGRGLQLLFIGIFASLPALLFYLFDRYRLSTVRDSFYRSVLSLDPSLVTYDDARSAFGPRVDEVLGETAAPRLQQPGQETSGGVVAERRGRLRRAKRLIVIIATLVITIGWILCLSPVGAPPAREDLLSYFVPAPAPIVFAFLGAYVFAINWLLHLYVRSDLKPKAYARVCVRVITAVVLGWAISAIAPSATASPQGFVSAGGGPGSGDTSLAKEQSDKHPPQPSASANAQSAQTSEADEASTQDPYEAWLQTGGWDYTLLILAFNIGFFPPLGFAVMREFLRNRRSMKYLIPSLEERLPVNELDGINLYHRARLLDEGVDNIENLAHADLIELLLQTRFPLPTLVDWVDQAILHLHVRGALDSSSGSTDVTETKNIHAISHLQSYGIMTATDLMQAYKRVKKTPAERDKLLSILGPGEPKKLQVVLHAIEDDEWMQQLKYYRSVERCKPRTVREEDLEKELGLDKRKMIPSKRRSS